MSRNGWIKRYVFFGIGLMISALGVAFTTKADLGTSPVTAIPYTMSLLFTQVSMGAWTIMLNCLQIFLQILMLGKNIKKPELVVQFVLACIYGYFIDFFMLLLEGFFLSCYVEKMAALLIGCVFIALGCSFEVIADAAMLAGDAFIKAVTIRFQTEYGVTRVASDSTLTAIAGILCLVFFHKLTGVREGTLVSALVVGWMIRFFLRKLKSLETWMTRN